MFGLGETWLEEDNQVYFEGFYGYFANFGSGKGVAGYSKIKLIAQPEIVSTESYSAIFLKQENFTLYFCTSVATLKQMNCLITLMFGLKKMCPLLSLEILIKTLQNSNKLLLQGK